MFLLCFVDWLYCIGWLYFVGLAWGASSQHKSQWWLAIPTDEQMCSQPYSSADSAALVKIVKIALRGAVLSLQNPSKHDRHANEFLRIMWYVRQRKKWRNLNVHICGEKT
uniref:Uncharacterized protein n=1 Tax=Glossina pallidipes TaxID=7398 RepID=A0A1B0A926_GLOPL